MAQMMRSMLYRLVKSRMTWAYAAVVASLGCVLAALVWADRAYGLGVVEGLDAPVPALFLWGYAFVQGSVLAMASGVFAASFVMADFKDGFVKNLMQSRGGRISYALSAVAVQAVAAFLFTLCGLVFSAASLALAGVDVIAPSAFDAARWYASVSLHAAAYAAIVVVCVAAARSITVGVVAGLVLGGGGVYQALLAVCAVFPQMLDCVRDALGSSLFANLARLAQGELVGAGACVLALGAIVFSAALCADVMRKRSVA